MRQVAEQVGAACVLGFGLGLGLWLGSWLMCSLTSAVSQVEAVLSVRGK